MIHALVLGLVIAIVLLILIQKVTSGFTAAECDARYTIDYRACGDAYEKAKRACRGRDKTSCEQTALRAKEACTDAAASAKIACLGPAAATGDVVATHQLQAAQNQSNRTSSPPAVSGSSRVTPGAALPPSDSHGSRGNQGNQGNQGGAAAPPPVLAVPAPPPVPAPAEAPSALQMASCAPGYTEITFPGFKESEEIGGGNPFVLKAGVPACRKPAPGPYECDFAAGYTYHSHPTIQPECIKARTA